MLSWRLQLAAIVPPATRAEALGRLLRRQRPLLATLAALVAVLALGRAGGPPAPGIAALGLPKLTALGLAAGIGLLAWHCARLTAAPRPPAAESAAAAALLAAATMPGTAAIALISPVSLLLFAAFAAQRQRVVALLVQCGAIVALALLSVNHIGEHFAGAAMALFSVISLTWCPAGVANDNPQMTRKLTDSRLIRFRPLC